MDRTLSPELLQRIRVHCDTFCTEHGLDAIREDLQDLIEEKTLSYLLISDSLQEEDAFLMARERFEDPEALKERFGSAATPVAAPPMPLAEAAPILPVIPSPAVSIARRLCVVLVLTMTLTIASQALNIPFYILMTSWPSSSGLQYAAVVFFNGFHLALAFAVALATILVLRRWNRRLESGSRLWFSRLHAIAMLVLLGGLLVLERLVPSVSWAMSRPLAFSVPSNTYLIYVMVSAVAVVAHSIQLVAWMWWVDRPPHRNGALVGAIAVWIALILFAGGALSVLPGLELAIVDSQNVSGYNNFGIELGRISSADIALYLRVQVPRMLRGGYMAIQATTFFYQLLTVALATPIYLRMRRRSRQRS